MGNAIAAMRACPEVAPPAGINLFNVFIVPLPLIAANTGKFIQRFALHYTAFGLNSLI